MLGVNNHSWLSSSARIVQDALLRWMRASIGRQSDDERLSIRARQWTRPSLWLGVTRFTAPDVVVFTLSINVDAVAVSRFAQSIDDMISYAHPLSVLLYILRVLLVLLRPRSSSMHIYRDAMFIAGAAIAGFVRWMCV